MADIKGFAPIDNIEGARGFALFPEIPELIEAIDGTASKAARFAVEHVGDEFAKFRKAVQRHANGKGYTAQFGATSEDKTGTTTTTQVALIPKVAGRPPKPDTETDGTPAAE